MWDAAFDPTIKEIPRRTKENLKSYKEISAQVNCSGNEGNRYANLFRPSCKLAEI